MNEEIKYLASDCNSFYFLPAPHFVQLLIVFHRLSQHHRHQLHPNHVVIFVRSPKIFHLHCWHSENYIFLMNQLVRAYKHYSKYKSDRVVDKTYTFADVSINNNPFSSAYALASSYSTVLLVPKSDLLPANAITISGLA